MSSFNLDKELMGLGPVETRKILASKLPLVPAGRYMPSVIEKQSAYTLTTDDVYLREPLIIADPDQATSVFTLTLPTKAQMEAIFLTPEGLGTIRIQIWNVRTIRFIQPDASGMIANIGNDVSLSHTGVYTLYAHGADDWRDVDVSHHEGYYVATGGTPVLTEPTDSNIAVNIGVGDIATNNKNYVVSRIEQEFSRIKEDSTHGKSLALPINLEGYSYVVFDQSGLDYLIASATADEKKNVRIMALPPLQHYTITPTASGTAETPVVIYQMEAGQQVFASHHTVINVASDHEFVTVFRGTEANLYPSNVHGVVLAKSGTGANNIGIDRVCGGANNYVYSAPDTVDGFFGAVGNIPFESGYNKCKNMFNPVAFRCNTNFKDCSGMYTPVSTEALVNSYDGGSIDTTAYVHGAGTAPFTTTVVFRADLIDLDGQGRGFKVIDTVAPEEKAQWSDQKTLSEKYLLTRLAEGKEQLSIAQNKQEMDTRTLVDTAGNFPIETYGGADGKMHYHSIYTAQPAGWPSAVKNKQVLIVPKTNSNSNKDWFFAFHEDYLSVASRFDKSMLGVNELFWDMDGIEYRTCGDGKSPNAGCVFQYNGMSVPIGSDVNRNNLLAVATSPTPFLDWAHVVSSDKIMKRGHLYSSGTTVTFTEDTTSPYFVMPANVGHGTTSIKWYEVIFIDTKVNVNPDMPSPYKMQPDMQRYLFELAVNSQNEYGTQLAIDLTN